MLSLAQLGDGFFTMFMVHENSLRQTITPGRSLGRMNATMRSLGTCCNVCGVARGRMGSG